MPSSSWRYQEWYFIAFIIGVGLAGWLQPTATWYWLAAGLTAICLALLFWPHFTARIFLIVVVLSLGWWRYSLTNQPPAPWRLAFYHGQTVSLVGQVVGQSLTDPERGRLVVRAEQFEQGQKVSGKVFVMAAGKDYRPGDRVLVSCLLAAPVASADFAYDRYLARQGIFSLCRATRLALLERQPNLYAYLLLIKERADQIIRERLVYPANALASAMVLGTASQLPADLSVAFSRTGLTHIIAISGLNISLLTMLVFSILLWLGCPRRYSFYLISILLLFYVLLVGAPASAVRAGLMGYLALWAIYLGRLARLERLLLLAAVITLAFNPRLARDDLGWQLSFLSLAGLIYLYPWLRLKIKSTLAPFDYLLELICLTVAAQLLTWPLVALSFQTFSVAAVAANLLAVWIAPLLLVAILAALAVSVVWPSVWWWLPAQWLLDYLISIARLLAAWPLSSVAVPHFSWLIAAVYYLLLLLTYWRYAPPKTNQVIPFSR